MTRSELLELSKRCIAGETLLSSLAPVGKAMRTASGYWLKYGKRLVERLRKDEPAFNIFFLKGNTKLPFVTFSTLPVFTCPGAGECATYCYSFKSWHYPAAYYRQLQNTLLLKFNKDLVKDAFLAIPKGLTLRLYVDGDFDSYSTFAFWMRMLKLRSDLKAYGYSKSWNIIHKYAKTHKVPSNYVLNLSSGGKKQSVTEDGMLKLSFVRGKFIGVAVDIPPKLGFKRYSLDMYHEQVVENSGGAFSCVGVCGECHKCGDIDFKQTIANGIH